uniref:RNA-directed RNA polymerase L n=1 Tax=Leptomonas pyrrhocoris leishbunyavirus 2 TaxID=3070840 RepID=A0AA50KJ46_9VIRU|nr:RNA-dependent RNA polymerase [Leptomonas pyrrhocoris leishbunyavirus 2]WMB96333.1 RNA-dependent RNA polymerase [Leptomonas pyrrhocoris leishbunyavirus 2]
MRLGRFDRISGQQGYVKVRDTKTYDLTDGVEALHPLVHWDSLTMVTTVSNIIGPGHMEALSQASRLQDSIAFDMSSLRDLPHSLVSNSLGGDKEMDLRILPIFNKPPTNKLTPDNYFPGDPSLFIEVKTTRGGTLRAFLNGIDQYGLSDYEVNCETYLTSLSVSDKCLTCSECLSFEQEEIDTLINLVRLGHFIQDEAMRQGCSNLHDEMPVIEVEIPEVELEGKARTTIRDDMLRHWAKQMGKTQRLWEVLPPHLLDSEPPRTEVSLDQNGHMYDPLWENHPMIPITGTVEEILELRLSQIVINPILVMLLNRIERTSRIVDGKAELPKHVSIPQRFEEVVQLSPRDYFRGLWGSLVDPQDRLNNVYRYHRDSTKATDKGEFVKEGILEDLIRDKHRYLEEKDSIRLLECDANLSPLLDVMYETMEDPFPDSSVPRLDGSIYTPSFMSEVWSQDARFCQTVFSELNVGRHSAKGAWNRFHVQTVGRYPAILITHGTGQDSHQFYFLLAKLSTKPRGKRFVEAGNTGWYYNSQILSVNSSKISQSLCLYEKLYNLRHFWQDLFKDDDRSKIHHLMSVLIAHDAKQSTIDMLSLFRYVYMEKTKPHFSDPGKILTKLPVLRTPLQQLISYRMRVLCRTTGDGADPDDDCSDRFVTDSWVDGKRIVNFRDCICLSYMHYATSHPVSVGLHTATKITSKILQMESMMPETMENIGWKSPRKPGVHEFHLRYVLGLGLQAHKLVCKEYPTIGSLMSKLTRECSVHDLAYFSTFKKSTRMMRKPTQSQRCYAFEAIKDVGALAGCTSPFERLQAMLDLAESPSGQKVSIFTKDQQTGLREIYVLTMPMRICIKFSEILSRIVNNCIPNETLCDANRKRVILENHQSKVRESCTQLKRSRDDLEHMTVLKFSNSADAKTWCQQFCMANFGAYLYGLLSSYGESANKLIRLLMKILNLISNKEIMLPDQIVDWFECHPETHEESEDFSRLRHYLKDPSRLGPNGGLKNESNMMQGIPHELSSSLHAMHTIEVGHYMRRFIGTMKTKMNEKFANHIQIGKEVISSMVSSDDSGVIISIPMMHDGSQQAKNLISNVSQAVGLFGLGLENAKSLMGARVSIEKSTIYALSPVYEFNSKFYYNSNEYTADIKFMTACITSGYHDNLIGRVSESLSSLSSCVSEGLTQKLCDHIQYSLNRMHRRFLYNHTDQETIALKVQSPFLGWVPLAPIGLIGLTNVSLLRDYLHSRNSPLVRLYDVWSLVDDEEFSTAMTFTLGSNSQYKRVVDRWQLQKDRISSQIAISDESVLDFLEGRVSQDLKVKIKLMSPGAKIAMSFVSLAKIHSASSYASNSRCMKVPHQKDPMSLAELSSYFEKLPEKEAETVPEDADIRTMSYVLGSSVEVPKARHPRKRNLLRIRLSPDEDISHVLPVLCRHWRNPNQRGFKLVEELNKRGFILYNDISETMRHYNGDPFRLMRLLRNIEQRSKDVAYYGPRVSSKGVLTTFPNFLASQWDTSTSMVTTSEGHREIVCKAQAADVLDSQRILEIYSKVREGWPFLKDLMLRRIDAIPVPEPVQSRLSKETLLVVLRGTHTRTRGKDWFFPLSLSDHLITQFKLDEKTRYMKQMGHWYKVTNFRADKTQVLREEGAPLPYSINDCEIEETPEITVLADDLVMILDNPRSLLVVTSKRSPDLKNPLVAYKIPCMSLPKYQKDCDEIDHELGEVTRLAYGTGLGVDYSDWIGIIENANDSDTNPVVRAACMHIMNQCMKPEALESLAKTAMTQTADPVSAFYQRHEASIKLPQDAIWESEESVEVSTYDRDALEEAVEILGGNKEELLRLCKQDCMMMKCHTIIQPLWTRINASPEPSEVITETHADPVAMEVDWEMLAEMGFGQEGDEVEEDEEGEEMTAEEALRVFESHVEALVSDFDVVHTDDLNLGSMLEDIQLDALDYFGGRAFEMGVTPWKRLSYLYHNAIALNQRKGKLVRLRESKYNPTNDGEIWVNQGQAYKLEENGLFVPIGAVDETWSEAWRRAYRTLRGMR